ncbi:MAG: TIM barrel protein [Chloroflexi bacterium]|nr:TIM barrel protein [Chloroflexota bacterium]
MHGISVACGQITWGRDYPREQVLAEIAQAGYDGAPAGRIGDATPAEVLALYARYGLRPAPGYLGLDWWNPDLRSHQLAQAARQAAFSRELGLTELYVASNLTPERRAIAGQVTPATATPTEDLKRLADLLNAIGTITLQDGVRACFHNHVGSPVETRDEIDRLFALVDRTVVFQGPDLGHLAWAGDDPVQLIRDYGPAVKTLHLKDISPTVRAEGIARRWDYRAFAEHGIFVELGEGMIDFPAVVAALRTIGFQGWIIVETDVTRKPSALESAIISRRYLASLGL